MCKHVSLLQITQHNPTAQKKPHKLPCDQRKNANSCVSLWFQQTNIRQLNL